MMSKPQEVTQQKTEKAPTGISWHDLTPMSRMDTICEIGLPLPWLFASWLLYASPFWITGPIASFMFFLCALRLNHEAIHNNLGLPHRGDQVVLHSLSFLIGASNHAVAHGHLVHHKHAMGPEDFEGKCGHMTFREVLLYGPRFTFDINRAAWTGSKPHIRRKIIVDWSLNIAMIAVALSSGFLFLLFHIVAMAIAQCLTALFAVWITHQGAGAQGVVARSQRGILARVAYLMFYHREHHLFPKVPVRRLPVLAKRLDTNVAGYATSRLPVAPLFEKSAGNCGLKTEGSYRKLDCV
ncbi:MAG: fatty acid desaturase [Boseongicola sp.]